ncbi:MAG: MoxR family ATPase, partial [Candidatus Sericytochromatia bacterium]|nr:MoxR family ATPase [Candidatus Sericytochromatia bacterium]
ERQVTIAGETLPLPQPFLVLATQNPIEQEGTYPLPEAQLDRFMFKVRVSYPTKQEELEIIERMTSGEAPVARKVGTLEMVTEARQLVTEVLVADKLKRYIVELVCATRTPREHGLPELAEWIAFGASPRASIYLTLAAKAHAFLRRRAHVLPEDIKAVAPDVLRHRILLSYEAEADGLEVDEVVRRILGTLKVP